jgi:hypothetical protein
LELSMSSTARRFKAARRVLYLGSEIPDDAPAPLKEGLARRRLVATTGTCPCGATFDVPDDLEPGTVRSLAIFHEDDCPAVFS